ncbi:hypothetical protein [Robbsia andropogonis]|uniref:hypothetical protein n=1 Tax=Robbsia andropogonis TaxID=28092 RepID=UPI00209E6231|nr:hypothetical protein [Robbsia andropogonis]MCP1120129.1 hypothetical protein [Robbsia andropogonis]MCP1130039.1 hypothetical protein [Robbsia andropogonis]
MEVVAVVGVAWLAGRPPSRAFATRISLPIANMIPFAYRRKRAIVLSVVGPTRPATRGAAPRAVLQARPAFVTLTWFHATAAVIVVAALLPQRSHARVDGSVMTTSVQVSLKIQQSCQIDSADASGAIAASGAASTTSASTGASGVAVVANPPTSGNTTLVASSKSASSGTGQGADAAPKVSCQFDEPYGIVTTTSADPTARAAVAPDGTTPLARFWTVLF